MGFFTEEQANALRMLYHGKAEEHGLMLHSLADFLEKEIVPTAGRTDKEKRFPRENLNRLFELDFAAMPFPEEVGGLALPYPVYVAGIELVAKACASTAITISIHGTVCDGIRLFGNKEQWQSFLKPMIKGRKLGSFVLTEPESGSDARAMKTNASVDGENYILNGSKMFITNAGVADLYLVFAKTENGPSAFLVDRDSPGLILGHDIEKLGVKGSKLMDVSFRSCKVSKPMLVGKDGEGFEYAKRMLMGGRITVAALSVGIAQGAFEKTVKYSKERKAFGQPIGNFQLIKQKLADMSAEINAARLLTYHAAFQKDVGKDFSAEAARAKLFASEMALRACDSAIQIHGGYGYADETDIHRHWRDAKLMTIGEGTSEIMRLIIANRELRAS